LVQGVGSGRWFRACYREAGVVLERENTRTFCAHLRVARENVEAKHEPQQCRLPS